MPAWGTEKQAIHHFMHGIAKGLDQETALVYAILAWNYEVFAQESAPRITSGRRSFAHQLTLRERWIRGDRRGLVVKPALHSQHTLGRAFDIERKRRAIAAFAGWAPRLGIRWGGNFTNPDPVHFDLKGSNVF